METQMIEFFFDCSSPWTYLAFRNLQLLAAELEEPISWRPVLVGGIFHSVNKGIYTVREDLNAPKNRYMLKDVQDSARSGAKNQLSAPSFSGQQRQGDARLPVDCPGPAGGGSFRRLC